jgi:transcriptional regulator GlxA family with amidase domain
LEETRDGVEQVATRVGFASAETMRRAFLRRVRVSPAAYRTRFRARA